MTAEKCACPHPDEHECYKQRYPAPMDDFARAKYFEEIVVLDLRCECICHEDEYRDENYE